MTTPIGAAKGVGDGAEAGAGACWGTHRTTGATSTAIFVILIVHCMCNMQHILPQLTAPCITTLPLLVLRLRNCSHVTRAGLSLPLSIAVFNAANEI